MNPFDDLIPRPGAVPNAPAEPDDEASPQFTNPMPGTLMEAMPAPRLPPVQNALASPPVAPEPGGWTDPQQYIEGFKGVIPGAIKAAGTTLQAPDVFAARGQQGSAAFGRAQIGVMDRIDRGEFVPETEDPIGYQHMTPDQRRAVRGDVQAASQAFAPTPVQDRPLYQAGEAVQNFAKTVLPPAPGYDKAFGREVGEGGGSLVFGLPFAFFGTLPGAAVFGSMGVGEATQRAVEFDRKEKAAGKPGLSQEQITTAGLLGIGPGMTDVAPVEVLLGRLPVRVPEVLRRPLAQGIGRIGIQATIEGVQEGGQGFLQDLIARETYNPNQVLGENFQRDAEVGGAVGGIAEFLKQVGTGMVRSAAGRRGTAQSATAQPAPEAPPLPHERQEPQLPWWAPPSQEAPPAATAEALPAGSVPPAATAGNPFSDLIPANVNTPLADAPWVAELAQGMAARKAGQPDAEPDRSALPSGAQPPDVSQPQPVRQPDAEPDMSGAMPPPSSVVTPDGSMEIEARPELVELDDLNLAGGALQPRDRSRAEYVQGARERASRLDPMQLQPSRVSDTGAPIVMPDGTVLSGNGRTMSIAEVYKNPAFADRAEAYRASLGPAAARMRQPVLVMRAADLTPAQAVQFADLSNRGRIAQMSATERAIRDAQSMGVDGISLYEGGDFTAPQNRRFLQDFMSRVVTTAERPSISRNGELTQEGVGRMRAAVLAAAYGDADVLARMLESTDDNVRSLTGGLLDAAPRMAQLRAGISSGEVSPDMDAVPAIMEAVRTISDLRSRKQPVQQWLAQTDAFGRDPVVEAWVKSFYYDQTNKAKGQQKVAALLNDYATEAMLHRPGGLFADTTTPNDVLGVAQRKNDADQAADLFAPAGAMGEGVQEGGAGTAGRPNAAGRKGLGKGIQAESAVSGDILAAIQSSPSRLEYEARELLRDVQDFESSLRAQNATPEAIATAINERYGTQVTADEIEARDVWWRPLPGENITSYASGIPEYAVENLLETERQATGNDIAPMPMDVDARPSSPQQIRGTTGAASPGPKLTQEMRERAAQLAQEGRPPRQIANVLKSETGRYVTATQIEDAIKSLTRVVARPRGRAVKRTPMSPEERREGNSARMRERMSSPEARALQAERARAQMSTPEAKAAQAAVMRATLARPEMQAFLKERGKALAAAKGYALWSPAMVERLGSPDIRSMTAEQAAAQLTREFPEAAVTRDSVRQKRFKLGYGFTGSANAPKISASIAERLADPAIRRLNANDVLDRLAAELGADAVAGISVQNINDKRNSDPRLAFTGKSGNPNLNAGKFAWSPEADARLVALMTEAPNPAARAEVLNAEFGGPGVPKLTAKATIKRWHKIRDSVLRSQGEEPMFALGPWVNAKNWLAWIGGNPNAGREDAQAERSTGDRSGEQPARGQSGAREVGRASDAQPASGRADGVRQSFKVREFLGRVVDAPTNAFGLRQQYVFLHPPKVTWPFVDSAAITLRNLDHGVPNWTAKAHVSEAESGVWQVLNFKVRKAQAADGLTPEFLDAMQAQLGEISAPDQMTPDAYKAWRAWETQGSRWNTTSIDGYVEHRGMFYSPDMLRALQSVAREAAVNEPNVEDRNKARREYNELSDLVDKLSPEDDVLAALSSDNTLRMDAIDDLNNGRIVSIKPPVVTDLVDRVAREAQSTGIKNLADVGVVYAMKPNADFATSGDVQLVLRTADGGKANAFVKISDLEDLRAATISVVDRSGQLRDMVILFRFDLTGYSHERLRGELTHEGFHLLRRQGLIDEVALKRVASHSDGLSNVGGFSTRGVMGLGLRDYLTLIKQPNASLAPNTPLRDLYRRRYKNRSDVADVMQQEAAAHMLELYENGVISDEQIAPVRPILDSILDGSIWRGRQGSERELETGDVLAAVQRPRDQQPQPPASWAPLVDAYRMGGDQGLQSEIGRRVPDLDAAESLWNSHPELGPMRWAGISIHDQIAAVARQLARQSNTGIDDAEIVAAIQRQRQRDIDSLGYYSAALEAARSLKQAKGTPEQMLAQLKTAGVKQSEIEATGLDRFLKTDDRPVYYHGTDQQQIDRFDLNARKPGVLTSFLPKVRDQDIGIHMTPDRELAGTYGKHVRGYHIDGNVKTVASKWDAYPNGLTPRDVERLKNDGFAAIFAKNENELIAIDPDKISPAGKKSVTRDEIVAHLDDGQPLFAFGGINAKTADRQALAQAEAMEKGGADRAAIWDATGWFRGKDGKWRFEIDDSGSAYVGDSAPTHNYLSSRGGRPAPAPQYDDGTLGAGFRHPKLYEAYPDIPGMALSNETDAGSYGEYDPGNPAKAWHTESIAISGAAPNKRSTGLHEIQHAVQNREGFALGGNYRMFPPEKLKQESFADFSNRIRELMAKDDESAEAFRALNRFSARMNGKPWTDESLNELVEHEDRLNATKYGRELAQLDWDRREADRRPDDEWREEAVARYRRLAGETESRAVQKRMNLTPDQRRARPPWLDYDVPEDHQIVKTAGKGVQKSTGDDVRGSVDGMSQPSENVFDWGPRSTSGSRETKVGDTTITYGVSHQPRTELPSVGQKYAQIILVETPRNKRGMGSARRALEQFVAEADKNGFTLSLTADPMDKGVSKPKLEKFYRSLGFVPNTGRNKDFAVMAGMIRQPKKSAKPRSTGGHVSPSIDLSALDRALAILRRAKVDG